MKPPQPLLTALGSLAVGIIMVAVKLITGLLTGSLGMIGDAVHSSLDVAASGFAYLAVRTARKPPDREHPFGHGRAENLAAFTEGILLLVTALGIGYEAVRRLLTSSAAVNPTGYAMAVMVAAIVVEAARAGILKRAARGASSQALDADADNRLADVASSAGVLAGLIGARAGLVWADAVAALAVALVVGMAAAKILTRSGDILVDRAVVEAEDDLRRAIAGVEGIREVRAVRVRRSGPLLLGEARIAAGRMLTLEGAQALTESARQVAARVLPDMELTLIVEGHSRAFDLVERIHAAAARHGGIRDLHNVTVEREEDGSLHLTMHAKLPRDLTLNAAGQVSSELEESLRRELPEVSRIDVHLEPLEPALIQGEDVTASQPALARRIQALVEEHAEVSGCTDVELSSRQGLITAHVVARMPGHVTLEHAHAVETELEARIRLRLPELHEVVARATPISS